MWTAGIGYNLSKRTATYLMYSHIRNDGHAANNFVYNPLPTVAPGADPRGFTLGIRHVF